jgi:excisionase family DNA binding protein
MGTNGNEAMSDRWLSLAEIASYLGVSKDSVYRWIETRDMPAQKIGRQWKFKVTEVDAWIRSGKANVAADPEIAKKRQVAEAPR